MTRTEVIVAKQAFRLGHRVGKGGEGVVYALADDNEYAVKLYTTHDSASKEAKIAAMVQAQLAGHAPLVAFPIAIARGRDGSFVGFVMRLVADHKPLHDLYSPGPRKLHFPQADYRFLVRTTANFARAVASVHQSNCVIGDINHSGILVSPKAVVALIDADSFQFAAGGQRFLCRVGVPEYTPPELQSQRLAGVVRTPNHDAFGLAVVIFQLLFMGRHPFVGTVRRGEIPPIHENIQQFRYVYTENRDVGMDQPPGTPSLSDFSPGIAALFDASFSRETADRRPTAEQWVRQLEALEASLAQCQENPLHYAPRDASECAWCEMERQLGTFLFLPYLPGATFKTADFDPGASGFDLDKVWARIAAINLPAKEQLQPKLNVSTAMPSANAKSAKRAGLFKNLLGYVIAIVAVGAFLAAPKGFILWGFVFLWGVGMAKGSASYDATPFTRAYVEAELLWARELQNWRQRIGLDDLLKLKAALVSAREAYRELPNEQRALREKYQNDRRESQLHAYLDGFDIQHATIKGIGPARLVTLASYGIDTAADVSRSKLLSVPGFGETTMRGLLEWRAKLEHRFVYRAEQNDADRQEFARIQALIEAKAAPLRRKLSGGAQNLAGVLGRVTAYVAKEDPVLDRVQHQREQAKADLVFLQIPTPQVASAPGGGQTRTTTGPSGPVVVRIPTSGPSSQSCPRCGSPMVKRLARRGRNAGGYFWGCSRYPRCKGTRNI